MKPTFHASLHDIDRQHAARRVSRNFHERACAPPKPSL
ncbi:hypothetical protein OH687_06665 [Burkholderia anthina]|nr:hypothetical protein OH687_06665 [Burkholderia anthina]